jgi:DNA-binding GntR family transcriptional regulator
MRQAKDDDDAETFLRADRQFHRTLLSISGNSRLAEFVDSLRNVVLGTGVSTANQTESIEEILEPHVELLRLVREHDAPGAARSMHRHVLETGRKLIGQEFGDDETAAFHTALSQLEIADLPS